METQLINYTECGFLLVKRVYIIRQVLNKFMYLKLVFLKPYKKTTEQGKVFSSASDVAVLTQDHKEGTDVV